MSLAAVAAGADGIIVEVHNEPDKAICDAAQQVATSDFGELTSKIESIAGVVGKTVSRA
jgi:3-deoxy-7-phosphoheptulonate synthase